MKSIGRACLVLVLMMAAHIAWADVQLAPIFGDGMVLQQGMKDPVWGTATAGEVVKVAFSGQEATATADANGAWRVDLGPFKAGGPWSLTVTGKNTITFPTVYVGDVWLCSGQSNMEAKVGRTIWDGIKNNVTPALRLCEKGIWNEASGDAINNFSAVGYYFGKRLYDDLALHNKMIPLGIIDNSLGATNISNWLPGGFCYIQRVKPIQPFALKGVVWYQGEFNPGDIWYAQELHDMVGIWRTGWGEGDLPFLVIQLHRYGEKPDSLTPPDPMSGWAITREQQVKATLDTPNTGLVVTYDLTDGNLHCDNKGPIGERVMRLAEGMCYGMGPSCATHSAIVDRAAFDAQKHLVTVHFKYADQGVRSGPGPHSEIADLFLFTSGGRVIPAKGVPCDPDSIAIDTHGVVGVPDVYYAWRNYPIGNLMNQDSYLWVSPFRVQSLHLSPEECRDTNITLVSNQPLDPVTASDPASYAVTGSTVTHVELLPKNMGVRLTTNHSWKPGEQVTIGFPKWHCWDNATSLPNLVFTVLPGFYATEEVLHECRIGPLHSIGIPGINEQVLAGSNSSAKLVYNLDWAKATLANPEEMDLLREPVPETALLTGSVGNGWPMAKCDRDETFNLLKLVKAPASKVWAALVRYDVYADKDMGVQLRIADQGIGRAFVNGTKVADLPAYTEARVPLAFLHSGWNVITLELSSDENDRLSGHNFFSLRILNANGSNPEGISYQATHVAKEDK